MHQRCIDPWLTVNATCPLCKDNVYRSCELETAQREPAPRSPSPDVEFADAIEVIELREPTIQPSHIQLLPARDAFNEPHIDPVLLGLDRMGATLGTSGDENDGVRGGDARSAAASTTTANVTNTDVDDVCSDFATESASASPVIAMERPSPAPSFDDNELTIVRSSRPTLDDDEATTITVVTRI